MSERFALGTVQFGLPYGIASGGVRVSRNEAGEILRHAREAHMVTLDTAVAYGESERVLGELDVTQWQVVSKLPGIPAACADVVGWVRDSVAGSLRRLGIPTLHGLLLHRPQELLGPQGEALYEGLVRVKSEGMARKIGVSVYDPAELAAVTDRFALELVQAPYNVFDRRLAASGWLAKLDSAGTEVHVRSVFLQGLLLMPPARRPPMFHRWQPLWDAWEHWLRDARVTSLQACVGFALSRPEIDRIVVGVDTVGQLQEILQGGATRAAMPPDTLMSEDPELINPSRWRTQ